MEEPVEDSQFKADLAKMGATLLKAERIYGIHKREGGIYHRPKCHLLERGDHFQL